jgi:hypothetical protein
MHIISESEFTTLRGKQPIFINAIEKGFHAWLMRLIGIHWLITG